MYKYTFRVGTQITTHDIPDLEVVVYADRRDEAARKVRKAFQAGTGRAPRGTEVNVLVSIEEVRDA